MLATMALLGLVQTVALAVLQPRLSLDMALVETVQTQPPPTPQPALVVESFLTGK